MRALTGVVRLHVGKHLPIANYFACEILASGSPSYLDVNL
jgi:hypothetical protein